MLEGRLWVVLGTRRALKDDMLPTLPNDDADKDDRESMLEDRDRPPLSLVLSFGAVALVSAFRDTFGTPKSPQLSSAERLTGLLGPRPPRHGRRRRPRLRLDEQKREDAHAVHGAVRPTGSEPMQLRPY